MPYVVAILRRANADLQEKFIWLNRRSPKGADRWYEAFESAIRKLESDAASYPLAIEAAKLRVDARECYFKTKHGKMYRIVFVIAGNQVRVLRVRGPGQRTIRRRDLGL
jgi:plasmid stabilization system protein ParE